MDIRSCEFATIFCHICYSFSHTDWLFHYCCYCIVAGHCINIKQLLCRIGFGEVRLNHGVRQENVFLKALKQKVN